MICLDHIAFRTQDKFKTANFFVQNFGYIIATSFDLDFEDDGKVECLVLKKEGLPEIFISDGNENTPVGQWVNEKGEGIHHLAFKTNSIDEDVENMKKNGIEFTTDKPLECDDLKQIFTKPAIGNVLIELIERQTEGFCKGNVKALMTSTKEIK